jgi:hypothetical protein
MNEEMTANIYEEAQRIFCMSDEVRISLERGVTNDEQVPAET